MANQQTTQSGDKKHKKTRKKLSKALIAFLALCLTGLVSFVIVSVYLLSFMASYVNGDAKFNLEDYKENLDQTTIIYAYNNNEEAFELTRLHGEQNRVWVTYTENPEQSVIPQNLANAYIALEDKRFKQHSGVDWRRVASVVLLGKGESQGGSTITQQLIKNLTGENKRTLNRKFYEILMALNLEKNASKETILEAYMNTVYMSNGCYGVKTAAEKYFGKDITELNLAECASLAAITNAPTKYNPLINPDNNRERQIICLNEMLHQEKITKEEYDAAMAYQMIFTNTEGYKPSDKISSNNATQNPDKIESYYTDFVIQSVISDLMTQYNLSAKEASKKIYSGGLRIYSAIDMNVQSAMENIYVNKKGFPKANKNIPDAQSAMTVMDYTGRVVGMVGGAGEKTGNRGLNRAANSSRQPGSSIKPLAIYAPAIDNKYVTWSTKIKNYGIKTIDGKSWPSNYGGDFGSPNSYITVQNAVSVSYNTVPAQILNMMGVDTGYEYLTEKFKFQKLTTADRDFSPLAVGGMNGGVSTLEMAAAYASFGNGGKYYKPYSYYKVTNSNGSTILLQHEKTDGEQIVSPDTADIMNELLQTVVTDPYNPATAKGNGIPGFQTFAKTGTTTDDKDRWFCGGTPYYVASVWFGCDKPKSLEGNVSGNPAGKIFTDVFKAAHKGLPAKSFQKFSTNVVQKEYCMVSGLLASESCTSRRTGWFSNGNMPGYCISCKNASIPSVTEPIPEEEFSVTQVAPPPTTVLPPPTTIPTTAQTTKPAA
ncbi:MAG: transglycosylase domain-containing protein [Oscillospiraceae bacterium]